MSSLRISHSSSLALPTGLLYNCVSQTLCGQIPHYFSQTMIVFTAFIIEEYSKKSPKFSISLSYIHQEIAYSIFNVAVPCMSLFGSVTHNTVSSHCKKTVDL
jgi:hypothetical protein